MADRVIVISSADQRNKANSGAFQLSVTLQRDCYKLISNPAVFALIAVQFTRTNDKRFLTQISKF